MLLPAHTVAGEPADTELPLNTVTSTWSTAVQEPLVTVSVYVVVDVGVATGFAILALLKPVVGDHA